MTSLRRKLDKVSVNVRHMEPCRRCTRLPICAFIDQQFGDAVERIHFYAQAHGLHEPELDVTLQCASRKFGKRNPT